MEKHRGRPFFHLGEEPALTCYPNSLPGPFFEQVGVCAGGGKHSSATLGKLRTDPVSLLAVWP